MEDQRARELLQAKRTELEQMLGGSTALADADRDAAVADVGDSADPAPGLDAEAVDDAVVASLRERLAALDRAEQRLNDGTYGRSVRSGEPIPDERLEVDPAAELTVAEAAAAEAQA